MKRILPLLLILYFGAALLLLLGLAYSSSRTDLAPEQPIAFSHKIHAGKLGLACTECHTTVEKSPRASVPPVSKCMSCHETAAVDRPEVQKLRKYWDDQEPIPWNRLLSAYPQLRELRPQAAHPQRDRLFRMPRPGCQHGSHPQGEFAHNGVVCLLPSDERRFGRLPDLS